MNRIILSILFSCFIGLAGGCAPTKKVPKDLPPLPLPEQGPAGAGGGRRPSANSGGGTAPAGENVAPPSQPAGEGVITNPTTSAPTDKVKHTPGTEKAPPSSGKEF